MTIVNSYRVELRGRLSDAVLGPYVDDFVVSRTQNHTVLTGAVRDAAHLHGIVTHLTSMGLELVSVAEIDTQPTTIDAQQLRDGIETGELIAIMTMGEAAFDAAHIPGSVRLTSVSQAKARYADDAPLVVYCTDPA
ncbi:MAG: rhodanese-like domain-containing protein, partial [Acidimicrobiales bacterium]